MSNRNDEMAAWLNEPSSLKKSSAVERALWKVLILRDAYQQKLNEAEKIVCPSQQEAFIDKFKSKLGRANSFISRVDKQLNFLERKELPAQQQAGQQLTVSKRGRPSKDSTNVRANKHELYQALEKWWLKMGKPSRTDFMKKLRALNEDRPNEYGLIRHPNAEQMKYRVQHEQNDITFTLGHIQKNILKEFEEKHSA